MGDHDELIAEIERLSAIVAKQQAALDEWGISDTPPILMEARKLDHAFAVCPGDSFQLRRTLGGVEQPLLVHQVTEAKLIDHVSIYKFTDALGYKHAMMGVFGEKAEQQ